MEGYIESRVDNNAGPKSNGDSIRDQSANEHTQGRPELITVLLDEKTSSPIGQGDNFNFQQIKHGETGYQVVEVPDDDSLPFYVYTSQQPQLHKNLTSKDSLAPIDKDFKEVPSVQVEVETLVCDSNLQEVLRIGNDHADNQLVADIVADVVDEVGVEAQENLRPVRHNWKMLLLCLIIFILGYQWIDWYYLNPNVDQPYPDLKGLFRPT